MFINSEGSTNGKLLDTRIPLYYGRPGDNYIPGRDSAIASPDNIYNSWYKQTYFVMVSDTPKEELSITDVTFYDYRSRLTAVVDASDPIVIILAGQTLPVFGSNPHPIGFITARS